MCGRNFEAAQRHMQLLWIQVALSIFVQDTKSIYQVEILTQGQIDLLDLKILLKHDYLF